MSRSGSHWPRTRRICSHSIRGRRSPTFRWRRWSRSGANVARCDLLIKPFALQGSRSRWLEEGKGRGPFDGSARWPKSLAPLAPRSSRDEICAASGAAAPIPLPRSGWQVGGTRREDRALARGSPMGQWPRATCAAGQCVSGELAVHRNVSCPFTGPMPRSRAAAQHRISWPLGLSRRSGGCVLLCGMRRVGAY